MKRALFLLTLIPLLLSCTNDEQAIREMCLAIRSNYPAATLQDVYKTCYQDFFGSEHLMRDTAAARYYLNTELASCANEDLSLMPLSEPTGFRHRFLRINLANVVSGTISEEALLDAFIAAASKENALSDDWEQEWHMIEVVALAVYPDWADEELKEALREAARLRRAVRHSDAFREAYRPHYRIIPANYLDQQP